MATRKRRESFGAIRKLPSGRIQASYVGPDSRRHSAPQTYDNITDARAWLAAQQTAIYQGKWDGIVVSREENTKQSRGHVLGDYATTWVETRKNAKGQKLRPKTQEDYKKLHKGPLAPLLGLQLSALTPELIRRWYTETEAGGAVTQTSHAYGHLKSILNTAVDDQIIPFNPCLIRGAQNARTGIVTRPPTDDELEIIVNVIRPRFRAMVQLAAWGGLRFGELIELRRKDLQFITDEDGKLDLIKVSVTRAVDFVTGQGALIGPPKTEAGVRVVTLPPFINDDVVTHLDRFVDSGSEALLWPATNGGHLRQSSHAKSWYPARAAAGRTDLRFHDLRHFHGTKFGQLPEMTTKELQDRLGHASYQAAMRYQHSTGRDENLVRLLKKN